MNDNFFATSLMHSFIHSFTELPSLHPCVSEDQDSCESQIHSWGMFCISAPIS